MTITRDDVRSHFVARSSHYDHSSSWCTDDALGSLIVEVAQPSVDTTALDLACGTGLVSRWLKPHVKRLVGADITEEMAAQARPSLDEFVLCPAEELPMRDAEFDLVVCRQGIQFMDLPGAMAQIHRVLKPGGRVVLVNLCAYSEDDRDEYFEVLRLRNPVRKHFFLPDDLRDLLMNSGFSDVQLHRYVSVEDVDTWSDNRAIPEERREAIRQVYRNASSAFRDLHHVDQKDGRFVDHMLFVVASGIRPGQAPLSPGAGGSQDPSSTTGYPSRGG